MIRGGGTMITTWFRAAAPPGSARANAIARTRPQRGAAAPDGPVQVPARTSPIRMHSSCTIALFLFDGKLD
jgi:hypothetical protein